MKSRSTLLILLMCAPAAAGGVSLPISERIQQSIADFEPAWLPPKGELKKLIVAIDPADFGDPARTLFATQTAAHLFHLVRTAGGVPVLTRADQAPLPGSENGSADALLAVVEHSRCHLALRLVVAPMPAPAALLSPSEQAAELSRQLAASFEPPAAAGISGGASQGPDLRIPQVTVTLPMPAAADPIARRKAHRIEAARIYRAMTAFALRHRPDLDSLRQRIWPSGEPADSQPAPPFPTEPRQVKMRKAARLIWPFGRLNLDQVPWYCELHRRALMSDRTGVYFEPEVDTAGETVLLSGGTSNAQLALGLIASLNSLGIASVKNQMRTLPDEARLQGNLFGACGALMARTFRQPAEHAGVQTQILYGEPLMLLDAAEGFYLLQAAEGYWGWVRQEAVIPMTRDQFQQYTAGYWAVLLRDLETPRGTIRAGSRLPVAATSAGVVTLKRPDDGTFDAPANAVRIVDGQAAAEHRVRTALDLLHTPYVFGARSTIGLDCSGLVGNTLEQCGLSPARDAAQQALSGKLVATRWFRDNIRTGDLIFFMDETGKIFHTGLALNATHFIHCAPPEVQISCWTRGDRLYNEHWENTFFVAKRP